MVKQLQRKFVTITMLLISLLIIILFAAFFIYNDYWGRQDTLEMLEWFAEGEPVGMMTDEAGETESGFSPVYKVSVIDEGTIRSIVSSNGHYEEQEIRKTVKGILAAGNGSNKWRHWLYVIGERKNEKIIVFTSYALTGKDLVQIAGSLMLLLLGLFILFICICYLSRFVTRPAQAMLDREKQFISDASHELKTPVAAIRINAQVLAQDQQNTSLIGNILSETDRMTYLIQELLSYSYLEEKGRKISKSEFSLSEACEEIVLTMESAAYEKGISYHYEIQPEIIYTGEEEQIKRLTSILLDNAIRQTPSGGKIEVNLKKSGQHPRLTVYNTGDGIKEEDLPYIFDRFYRVDKDRNRETGSFGLGLSIARSIVQIHGGSLSVKSEYGKYAAFTTVL